MEVRSAFETNLGIRYIFQDPTQLTTRALSYKVCLINQDLEWVEKILEPEVTEAPSFELTKSSLAHITNEWNNKATSLRRSSPNWYSLFRGPSNIFKLAQRVNMENEYRSIYAGLSATSHGTTASLNATLEDPTGRVLLWPLRDVDKIRTESSIRIGRSFLLRLISNQRHHKNHEI